ncbi:hypothetical protein PV325_007517 [Microctonus aethiopoides]|nr:hypothetical protein PV325_007517 [Microctonus aethiopoides]
MRQISVILNQLNDTAKAINEGKSVNTAAKDFGIKRMTFMRFMKKLESNGGVILMDYAAPRQVFSPMQENLKKN